MDHPHEVSRVVWGWRDAGPRQADERRREASAARRRGAVGGAVGLAAAVLVAFGFDHPVAGAVIAGIALALAATALASPLGAYATVSRGLERFARAVASAVTWVLMTLLYYLVVLPLGLVLRARGRLRITRRPDPALPSYWTPTDGRERPADSYRRQF